MPIVHFGAHVRESVVFLDTAETSHIARRYVQQNEHQRMSNRTDFLQ